MRMSKESRDLPENNERKDRIMMRFKLEITEI